MATHKKFKPAEPESGPKKNVVVFGSSGQGKTSILNLLCGLDLATSDAAIGCTFDSTEIAFEEFNFIDTAGLNETDSGTVTAEASLLKLVKLLKSLQNGVALLVFVKRQGKLLAHDKANYDMFVNEMTKGAIPILCLITGCEEDAGVDMQRWPTANEAHFNAAGMEFASIVGCCAKKSSNPAFEAIFAPIRVKSKQLVLDAIRGHAAAENVELPNTSEVLRRMWNKFCGFFGSFLKPFVLVSESLQKLFLKITGDPVKAKALAGEVEGL